MKRLKLMQVTPHLAFIYWTVANHENPTPDKAPDNRKTGRAREFLVLRLYNITGNDQLVQERNITGWENYTYVEGIAPNSIFVAELGTFFTGEYTPVLRSNALQPSEQNTCLL